MRTRVVAGHEVVELRSARRPWILLHGFTQGAGAFRQVVARLPAGVGALAVALPGHAALPPADRGRSFERTVDDLARAVRALGVGPVPVLGYSLGARLAFGLTARHPHLVRRLVAVGGHPGLEDEQARRDRAASDHAWAERIRAEGLTPFVQAWSALPLFASQAGLPTWKVEAQARLRRGHRAGALADALEQLSLARMPSWRRALGQYRGRVDLVVGAEDAKFRGLAEALAPRLAWASVTVAPGVGHNVVLEDPATVARVMVRG